MTNTDLRMLYGARYGVPLEHMAAALDSTPAAIADRLRDLCGGDPTEAALTEAILARCGGAGAASAPSGLSGRPETPKATQRPAQALSGESCTCAACRWRDGTLAALAGYADDMSPIQAAALIIVTQDEDQPDNPAALSAQLLSFQREPGVLSGAIRSLRESLDDAEEAAPWLN